MAESVRGQEFWTLLGERIREARESQALSAVEMGQRLGYSEDTIYNWEKARRRITLEDLLRVSEQTGKPISWFLGESPGAAFEAHLASLLSKPLAEFMPTKEVPIVPLQLLPKLTGDELNQHIYQIPDFQMDLRGSEPKITQIAIPRELGADFAVRVLDNQMARAGIFSGDLVICRNDRGKSGDLVVAHLPGGSAALRFLVSDRGQWRLLGAGASAAQTISADREEVIGVVLQVIRDPQNDAWPVPEPDEEWGRVRDAADRAGLSAADLIRMIAAWQAAK